MKLIVTRRQHTHAGKTYRVGESFDGSERLLAAFGDRLEKAPAITGGATIKGGHNPAPSKVTERPKAPTPTKPRKAKANANTSDSK